MSWSLNAAGHLDDPGQEGVLAAKIGNVLEEFGPGVSNASFSGSHFSGDPRELARQQLQPPDEATS